MLASLVASGGAHHAVEPIAEIASVATDDIFIVWFPRAFMFTMQVTRDAVQKRNSSTGKPIRPECRHKVRGMALYTFCYAALSKRRVLWQSRPLRICRLVVVLRIKCVMIMVTKLAAITKCTVSRSGNRL